VATRWTQAATILPPTIKVCGRRLLPFCLRHRVALEAINSPVLNINASVGATDIINAVRILSTHDMAEARKPLGFIDGFYYRSMQLSRKKLQREANKLLIYFTEQSLWPRFWEESKNPRDRGIDWPLIVVANLTRNGCSLTEAWTMPESEAVWMHIANLANDGVDVKIVTETEWLAMENEKRELEEEQRNLKQTPQRSN
jgi:hypothetical protein